MNFHRLKLRFPKFPVLIRATKTLIFLYFLLFLLVVQIVYKTDKGLEQFKKPEQAVAQTIIITPTIKPVQEKVVQQPVKKQVSNTKWGVAQQIDEHTWTMKVGEDEKMATPSEILQALNTYRIQHGAGSLAWDQALANYAQERANGFAQNGTLDGHAGFTDYVNNQDGFNKLGFYSLGENSSNGYNSLAVHLIEWIYAGDKPHNDNQLNPQWTHVGIGVSGTATNLVFGGRKK